MSDGRVCLMDVLNMKSLDIKVKWAIVQFRKGKSDRF